jgi:hypothetical protein
MIVYYAVPYTIDDLGSMNRAMSALNAHLGSALLRNDKIIPVCALYSVYGMEDITWRKTYMHSKLLLDSAQMFVIVQLPGYEYSDVIMNEAAYAAIKNIPIILEDPYDKSNTAASV